MVCVMCYVVCDIVWYLEGGERGTGSEGYHERITFGDITERMGMSLGLGGVYSSEQKDNGGPESLRAGKVVEDCLMAGDWQYIRFGGRFGRGNEVTSTLPSSCRVRLDGVQNGKRHGKERVSALPWIVMARSAFSAFSLVALSHLSITYLPPNHMEEEGTGQAGSWTLPVAGSADLAFDHPPDGTRWNRRERKLPVAASLRYQIQVSQPWPRMLLRTVIVQRHKSHPACSRRADRRRRTPSPESIILTVNSAPWETVHRPFLSASFYSELMSTMYGF